MKDAMRETDAEKLQKWLDTIPFPKHEIVLDGQVLKRKIFFSSIEVQNSDMPIGNLDQIFIPQYRYVTLNFSVTYIDENQKGETS